MAASRADTNKWIIAVTVILGTYVAVIDVTIVNIAMLFLLGLPLLIPITNRVRRQRSAAGEPAAHR